MTLHRETQYHSYVIQQSNSSRYKFFVKSAGLLCWQIVGVGFCS